MAIPNDIILMLSGAILVLLIVVSCHNLGKTAQITPPSFIRLSLLIAYVQLMEPRRYLST
jgi:hypothetical protein